MQAARNALRSSLCRLQTRNAATAPSKANPRRMKYPYTYAAKWDQFPWKMYYKESWVVRYYVPGLLVTLLLFWKINKLVNSPANVAAFEELARKEAEAKHKH